MKLDRNLNGDGRGKYGLILSRKLAEIGDDPTIGEAMNVLEKAGVIDWGDTPDIEFFVIKLKDINAQPALRSYAGHARQFDAEYSGEVMTLADRAGVSHPHCKRPD